MFSVREILLLSPCIFCAQAGADGSPDAESLYNYRMPDDRRKLGDWGESHALDFLLRKGDRLIARNVRTRFGEIDLITLRGGRLIFVEIKTRNSSHFGYPEESVNAAKQKKLTASAHSYLDAHPEFDVDWQIDVIAIRIFHDRPPEVTHLEDAVAG